VSVAQEGFAPFEAAVDAGTEPLTIELAIGNVTSSVIVRPERPTLETAAITADILAMVSNRTSDLIDYARRVAGAAFGQPRIFVDNLPAGVLPPSSLVQSITVNANPFSAEFNEGDDPRIDIETRAPDRQFHFALGGGGLGFGGGSVLEPELRARSQSFNGAGSGPVPGLPLTFSGFATHGASDRQQPLLAVVQEHTRARPVDTRYDSISSSLAIHHAGSNGTRTTASVYRASSHAENLGAGGVVLEEAASHFDGLVSEARGTFSAAGSRLLYETGFVVSRSSAITRANSRREGIEVVGAFVGGGAEISHQSAQQTSWTWRNAFRGVTSRRAWSTGLVIMDAQHDVDRIPNPEGIVRFSDPASYGASLEGGSSGSRIAVRGQGQVTDRSTSTAAFFQSDQALGRYAVGAGVRADFQTRGQLLLSPRLAVATERHGVVLRGSVGMFARAWPSDLFLQIRLNDGQHFRQILTASDSPSTVTARASDDFQPSRSWVMKTSIERPLRSVVTAVQYTWAHGSHLAGSRRIPGRDGWTDLLESNRSMRRHSLHALARFERVSASMAAHYSWMHARDNSDGPFSPSAQWNSLADEWARSAGISPHTLSGIATFRTVADIWVTAAATARSAAPYNVTMAEDLDGNGIFNDRNGRPRNAERGKAFQSLDVSASRRFALAGGGPLSRLLKVDVGVQAENLLGRRNYAAYGSVIGSPLFGQPVTGMTARTVRAWVNWAP
jgi:hypothetical protein